MSVSAPHPSTSARPVTPASSLAATKQRSLRSRRVLALLSTQAAILVAYTIAQSIDQRLGRSSTFTGAMLATCVGLLTLLGVRRRLPLARFGRVATWTQVHLYLGIFSIAAYAMHVPRIIADGILEGALSWTFLAVAVSGLYGIYASRTIPRRLTALGDEVRFDRFELHRDQVRVAAAEECQRLHDDSAASTVLIDFYQAALVPYFGRRPAWHRLMFDRDSSRAALMRQLKELDRYLDPHERSAAGSLAALNRRRDELDHSWVLQVRLRSWVLFHLLMTFALLVLAASHIALVLRYTG